MFAYLFVVCIITIRITVRTYMVPTTSRDGSASQAEKLSLKHNIKYKVKYKGKDFKFTKITANS